MRGKVRVLGKTVPAWAIGVALIVATAGAATGTVLAGQVTGTVTTTASQALLVRDAPGTAVVGADAGLVTLKDDGTAFHAAAEVNTGDSYRVDLALENDSGAQLTGELSLIGPEGITLSVDEANDVPPDVVRTGPFSWKFRLNQTTNKYTDLKITVALADDMSPGFYAIDGKLKQVAQ